MTPAVALATVLLAAGPSDRLAVVGLAEPPSVPPELAALTGELRTALRARDGAVLDVRELRLQLLPVHGAPGAPSVAELDRAYEAAVAAYQLGDYRAAVRKLRKLLEELDRAPESAEAHARWLRAALRLAHAELTVGNRARYRAVLEQVALVAPRHEADPDEFSPTFRRDLEDARKRVGARPRRALSVQASGAGDVFVDGRPVGSAPVTVRLPAGRHRIGGVAGAVRVPATWIELGGADETVSLDFATAAALRIDGGPALLVAGGEQDAAVATFGRWVGAARTISTRLSSDGGDPLLVGALHDARGAVLREARIRTGEPAARAPRLAALAAFLLTGAPSALMDAGRARDVAPPDAPSPDAALSAPASPPDLRVPEPTQDSAGAIAGVSAAPARPRWMKPAAVGSAGLSVALAALAVQQALASRTSYDAANGMLGPDGVIADRERYRQLTSAGDRGRRNALLGAGGAVLFAAGAGVLGHLSWTAAGPAIRF